MKKSSTKKYSYVSKEQVLVDIDHANTSGTNVRKFLNRLHIRKAWELLGYRSYRAMAKELLNMGDSAAYREAQAARAERRLGLPIGGIRESVLRPVFGLPKDSCCEIFARAKKDNQGKVLTAKMLRIAGEELGYLDSKVKKKDANDPEGILAKITKVADTGYLKRIALTARDKAREQAKANRRS